MGISKHGRVWWLDIQVKGQRIRRSLGTTNRNEALARFNPLRERLIEKYSGERVLFSDFCEKYLEWAWSSKPFSALREEQRLRKIQKFFSGLNIVYLDDITPYHIEQLKAKLKNDGSARSTTNRYLQILRGMFYKAIDWETYKKPNPLKKIKFYKEVSPVDSLTSEQVKRILTEASRIASKPLSPVQRVFHSIIILAINTGMRKSEILNLKWKDIRTDTVRIKGKGDKLRIVPLNETSLAVITKQPRRDEYVFDIPNRHQPDLFRRTILRIRSKTGISWHFHQLRHYFTTKLIENSVDFITIGSLLGHSSRMTTLIYGHTDKDKMKKAVDLLEK